ncbi:HET-E1 [Symbiodinium natans]|uniref:HET-E1 protein n=1 Tax=Symbiodinium natans TaxID=878477 RepID=A0A812NFH0_9DINO|nr:HET-E1 [Symbiodinium natans]
MAMHVVVSMETVGDDAAEPFFTGTFGGCQRDWEGEIGIRFMAEATFVITSLGRYVGDKEALEEERLVTLWLAETETKLASVEVGPSSPISDGYAYTEVFPRVIVRLGREYRLTQTCRCHMKDAWPDAADIPTSDRVDQRFARFLGGAYDFHGGYPSFCDAEDGRRAGMLNFKAVPGIATLPICPEMTVYELKQQLETVTGVPPVQQKLSFGGRLMSKNDVALASQGVEHGHLLVLAVQAGSVLATASKDGTARLWSAESGECLRVLAGHRHSVVSIEFAPSGSSITTASLDGTARIWSVETGSCSAELTGHTAEVFTATFAPSGGQVLTASQDHTARVWSLDGTCTHVLGKHLGAISAARFSPDGSRIVTASTDCTARVWEPVFGTCLLTIQGHSGSVSIAAISPDSTMMLTSAIDTQGVLLRDASSGHVMRRLCDGLLVHTAAFSPDGSMIVAACCDWAARLWSCDDGHCLQELRHEAQLRRADFCADGSLVVTISANHAAFVWQVATGKLVQTISQAGRVVCAAFSPDSVKLVTGGEDAVARVWDVASGNCKVVLAGHEVKIESAAFSP